MEIQYVRKMISPRRKKFWDRFKVIGYIIRPEYTDDVLYRRKMYVIELTIYCMMYTLMEWLISIVM